MDTQIKRSEIIKSKLCKNCARCCQVMVLPVARPLNKSMEGSMTDWMNVRGCEVVAETPTELFVKVSHPCPHLGKSYEGYYCDIYENRPYGCKEFDGRTHSWLKCAWKDPKLVLKSEA